MEYWVGVKMLPFVASSLILLFFQIYKKCLYCARSAFLSKYVTQYGPRSGFPYYLPSLLSVDVLCIFQTLIAIIQHFFFNKQKYNSTNKCFDENMCLNRINVLCLSTFPFSSSEYIQILLFAKRSKSKIKAIVQTLYSIYSVVKCPIYNLTTC